MCSVKTPKPATPPPGQQQKPPVYMRNAFLDGLGINSENAGRNSLRIDLGSGRAPTAPNPRVTPPLLPPIGIGGGGSGRGGGLGIGPRRNNIDTPTRQLR